MKKFNLVLILLLFLFLTPDTGLSATKIFSDGFEDGTWNAWTYHDTDATIISSGAHGGTYCDQNNYYPTKNTFAYKILASPPTSELYISFWVKVDSSYHHPYLGFKPLRLLKQNQDIQMEFWILSDSWNLDGYFYGPAAGESYYLSQSGTCPLTDHEWHHLETYIKYNTAGVADGIQRIWWDANDSHTTGLRFERTNINFRSTGNGGVVFDKFDFPSNAGDGTHYSVLGDIIYIDDVEIWDGMPNIVVPNIKGVGFGGGTFR